MPKIMITGASKGIGEAIRQRLGLEYDVVDISRSTGYNLLVRLPDEVCDVLVLNAGVWNCPPIEMYKLNYLVPKQMAQRALTRNPKTHIIFVLSNAAYQNFGNDDYTAQKAGLLHFAKRLQREGHKVSTISPGTVNTDFWKDAVIDNREKGCMEPDVVAELIYSIIKAGENGALVTELIVIPKGDKC